MTTANFREYNRLIKSLPGGLYVKGGRIWDYVVAPYEEFPYQCNNDLKKGILAVAKIGKCEMKNAESTILIVEKNSAIDFEPSMLYQYSKENLLWKSGKRIIC